MSLINNTEKYEISLPMEVQTAFDLIERAADEWGKIIDSNRALGIIRFKKGMSLFRNPVKFTANLSKQGDDSTLVRFVVNSNDGAIGLNSSDRAYQEFLNALSESVK